MKNLFLLSVILFSVLFLHAQAYNPIGYKVLITENGTPLANKNVTIRFTIISNSTTVYSEENHCTTDENGIASTAIGNGMVPSSDFDAIDWTDGDHYLKVEIDTGNGFVDYGTNQFLTVPYAIHANKSDSATYVKNLSYDMISNTPVTFYKSSTSNALPSNITDTIYHTGNIYIGGNFSENETQSAKLYVRKDFTKDGNTANISTKISSNNNVTYYGLNTTIYTGPYGAYYGHILGIRGSDDGNLFGLSTYIDSDGDGFHYGTQNRLTGAGNGNIYSTYNEISSSGTGINYGNYSLLSGDGSGKHYGSYAELSGAGSGTHYGQYSLLAGDGTGEQYGTYNFVSNTKDADQYGTYNTMSGNGSGKHYGTYNKLWGTGTGSHYGVYNDFFQDASNYQYGVYTNMHNNGSGRHYGTYNKLSGTGTGVQYGTYNEIQTTNDMGQYGTANNINNNGNGPHVATHNQLLGTGNGDQTAVYNIIQNSGSGVHYGVHNILYGNGSGATFGVDNNISGSNNNQIIGTNNIISNSGTGAHYGTVNTITNGSGQSYGTFTRIEGTSSYSKFGEYIEISSTSGGTHYGIFSNVEKSGSYAGYFNGDVKITKKLKSSVSGDADMKAYAYGFVLYTGALQSDRSSSGFSVVKPQNTTGIYEITLTNVSINDDHFVVTASAEYSNNPAIAMVDYVSFGGSTDANKFYVRIFNLSGNPVDGSFHFVVYKK